MKRYILFILVLLFLSACGANETEKETQQNDNVDDNEIETLSSEDVEIEIIDNEQLNIELQQVNHGRIIEEETDYISLKLNITNKQDRTYEMYLNELVIDGHEVGKTRMWIDKDKIGPNETIEVYINAYEYEELSVKEHVSGTIVIRDYEGNRHEVEFSSYINE